MNNLSISHVIEWISAVTKQSGYLLSSLSLWISAVTTHETVGVFTVVFVFAFVD